MRPRRRARTSAPGPVTRRPGPWPPQPLGARRPPWLWHPSVVEELLWLRRSWTEAFTGSTAAIFRVADWHDRQRPGVVARIRALNDGVCSLDRHAPGAEQDRPPPRTPAVDAIPGIVDWWAARREESPPHPDETVHADDVVDGR